MNPICIYHGNCADGFGAAWAVRFAFGARVEFHAGVYQDPPPDVAKRDVIMVDFSYKRDVLAAMSQSARSITILDHHKSAAEDLAGLDEPPPFAQWRDGAPPEGVRAIFDMNRSGAGLAWDYFVGGPRVPLIDYIEDRDLWRFALHRSREVNAVIFSYPYQFVIWDSIMECSKSDEGLDRLIDEGAAIERKHHKDVAELVSAFRREMIIGGHWVPVANIPYTHTSDAGHLMCKPYVSANLQGDVVTPPFAACYWDTPDGRVFSLRSDIGGADVSEIAKQYGGGGHKSAAGFRVPFAQIIEKGLM